MSKNEASKYGILMFAFTVCYGIGLLHHVYYGQYFAMRIRVALSSLIYRKVILHFGPSHVVIHKFVFINLFINHFFFVSISFPISFL